MAVAEASPSRSEPREDPPPSAPQPSDVLVRYSPARLSIAASAWLGSLTLVVAAPGWRGRSAIAFLLEDPLGWPWLLMSLLALPLMTLVLASTIWNAARRRMAAIFVEGETLILNAAFPLRIRLRDVERAEAGRLGGLSLTLVGGDGRRWDVATVLFSKFDRATVETINDRIGGCRMDARPL